MSFGSPEHYFSHSLALARKYLLAVFIRSTPIPVTYKNTAYSTESTRDQKNQVEGGVPSQLRVVRFIRGAVAILIELRVLIAELMFTAAALYACYIAYEALTHRLL